jgi:hypothetical protein
MMKKKRIKIESTIDYFQDFLYKYRYDLFSITILFILIMMFFSNFFQRGLVVFSDLDFPFHSDRYLDEIFATWNTRWSTSTSFNMPRLLYVLPSYLVSSLFQYSGEVFQKVFIIQIFMTSAISMYLFSKRVVSVYYGVHFDFYKTFSIILGSFLYAVNPYSIMRIQHIYLLCGYSLFPILILFFFRIYDHKFQKLHIRVFSPLQVKPYFENIKDIALFGFFLSMASGGIHYFFFTAIYFAVLLCLLLLKYTIKYIKYNKAHVKKIYLNFIIKSILLGLFIVVFCGYWLLPYLLGIVKGVASSQHNINVSDTFVQFSRNGTFLNSIYLIGYWWPMVNLNDYLGILFYGGGFVLLALIFLGVFLRSHKYSIVLFFSLLSVLFLLISTGVKYDYVKDVFLIINRIPVIGSMFRDPNKITGLLVLNYSLLLVFGLESIYHLIKKFKLPSYYDLIILSIGIISLWLYVSPFKEIYMENFYRPIEEPVAYQEFRKYQEHVGKKNKVLYLPIADNMLQDGFYISTPRWNSLYEDREFPKATGDIHVYNSYFDTIFHHEGSSLSLTKYLNYIQELLDSGKTMNIKKYFRALGVNDFIYHDEYMNQEKRQKFNREILSIQRDMLEEYSDEIFTVYPIMKNRPLLKKSSRTILSPYSYSSIEAMDRIMGFDYSNGSIIYSNLNPSQNELMIGSNDFVEAKNYNDIILSLLDEKYYLYPFDYLDLGNPFLGWSKTFVDSIDWKWYLKSHGIQDANYSFDREKGVIATFVSRKLDVEPQNRDKIKGKKVFDFDTLLKLEKFFSPDNPDLFQVVANPKYEEESFPLLRGSIVKGDPKDIWQVAKSGVLRCKENNPYRFNLIVSGRGANKLHIKVRFFDENQNELSSGYIMAPEELVDFNGINFYGEFMTPEGTSYFRLDLLTFQRPESKVFWWVHDIDIFDLEAYKAKNIVKMDFLRPYEEDYQVFIRLFTSPKGGKLRLKLNDKIIDLNTSDKEKGFKWIDLGRYRLKKANIIDIENISGLNSVNALITLPIREKEGIMASAEKQIEKGNFFMLLEAEADFKYSGNLQSSRVYPNSINGRLVSSYNGIFERDFDIIKNGIYKMEGVFFIPDSNLGNLKFEITNQEGKIFYREVDISEIAINGEEAYMVDHNPKDSDWGRFIVSQDYIMKNRYVVKFEDIKLKKGSYKLRIMTKSDNKSLGGIDDLQKFDFREIRDVESIDVPLLANCSPCESISWDMMNHSYENETIRIDYEKTCSCDWYIYSTTKIDLIPTEEFLISYKAKSESVRKRHGKVVFLDDEDYVVDTVFINEVEEKYKNQWNEYNQIVKAPKDARKMMLQFWTLGNQKEDGYLEIKDMTIYDYKSMIAFDSLGLFQNKFTKESKLVSYYDELNFYLDKGDNLINLYKSPSKSWVNNGQISDLKINGVTKGFYISQKGDQSIYLIFESLYKKLIVLFAFGCIFVLILPIFKKKKRGE